MNFTHNDRLRLRFFERMEAYQCLWSGIGFMSSQYVRDAEELSMRAYRFLSEMPASSAAGPAVLPGTNAAGMLTGVLHQCIDRVGGAKSMESVDSTASMSSEIS